uniref:Uncharacterized protein n=1 Tax=Wuchereria bancrofti TaxID=6293 RepID=A0A1I8EN35_WUCBA
MHVHMLFVYLLVVKMILLMMRTIAIIAITIFALEPYRHATFLLFSGKKCTLKVISIPTQKITRSRIPLNNRYYI